MTTHVKGSDNGILIIHGSYDNSNNQMQHPGTDGEKRRRRRRRHSRNPRSSARHACCVVPAPPSLQDSTRYLVMALSKSFPSLISTVERYMSLEDGHQPSLRVASSRHPHSHGMELVLMITSLTYFRIISPREHGRCHARMVNRVPLDLLFIHTNQEHGP
jgi:hypothetical protein